MISSACVPIEPVAPRSATLFIRPSLEPRMRASALYVAQRKESEVRSRGGEEQRVDAIEDAAVGEQDPARVLDAEIALDERLEEIAERRGGDHDGPEHERAPGLVEDVLFVEGEEAREHAG